eukprot:CAMPEP_0201654266 /NCGR_PEP_ID=MMETSP0493-20130528/45407_1 /ASSEMBLY_ACC=CAM_ASM_000838 /TAXON_ID=420259 /ORGANISM="Thalassiosira gravida, Strain GMp14c1" /LENGTH=516 /DNA_ID=CAMNT_0048130817 /DNA_START=530 /DNA_END=2081 /DNA_ORIENTATION=+
MTPQLPTPLPEQGFSAVQLRPYQISERLVDGSNDNDATTANAASDAAPSFQYGIKSHDLDVAVSTSHKGALDIGILNRKQKAPDNGRRLATKCPGDSIMCENGIVAGGNDTCESACDGSCCVGVYACVEFTGELCMDNVTCMGYDACYKANIDLVVGGCNGFYACAYAAEDYGSSIGAVSNSCRGDSSCLFVADDFGSIDGIFNSCIGEKSCESAADRGGKIGALLDSCHGERACYRVAFNNGDVMGIYSSCNETEACSRAAEYGGSIGAITSSCVQSNACERTSSCDPNNLQCGSIITEISDSCVGPSACYFAAYDGVYIGGIRGACNASRACIWAGMSGSDIPSGIENCCNEDNMCLGVTEATLPAQCEKNAPTVAPSKQSNVASKSPTTAPTAAPTMQPSTDSRNDPSKQATVAPVTSYTMSPMKKPTAEPSMAPFDSRPKRLFPKGKKKSTKGTTKSKSKSEKTKASKADASRKRIREHHTPDAASSYVLLNPQSRSDQQQTQKFTEDVYTT